MWQQCLPVLTPSFIGPKKFEGSKLRASNKTIVSIETLSSKDFNEIDFCTNSRGSQTYFNGFLAGILNIASLVIRKVVRSVKEF